MNVMRDRTLRTPAGSRRVFAPVAATVNGLKTVAVLGGLGGLLVALGSMFGRGGALLGLDGRGRAAATGRRAGTRPAP